MANIEKIRENLYIKKGWDGYRVVYPNKIDLDKPFQKGNINWKNVIGRWPFWIKGLFFLILLYAFVQGYLHDTKQCRDFVNNIDTVCYQYQSVINDRAINYSIDYSINSSALQNMLIKEKENG